MARGRYEVHGDAQTVSTAITLLEITAPATAALMISKIWVNQSSVTTSAQTRIRILRKTATITGTAAAPTPVPLGSDSASGTTVKWLATVEGTDGNVVVEDSFNYLNGYIWQAISPDMRMVVAPSTILAIKFPAAPSSATFTFGMEFEEIS